MGAEESRALGLRGGVRPNRQMSELNDLKAQLLLAAAVSSFSGGSGSGRRDQFIWDRTDCSFNLEVVDSGRKVNYNDDNNNNNMK